MIRSARERPRLPAIASLAPILTQVLALALILCLLPAAGQAQQIGMGNSDDTDRPAGPQGGSAFGNLLGALESGGNLFIGMLRPEDETGTIRDPEWTSLASPRHAVLTFMEAMGQVDLGYPEAWPRALQALALPPETDQATARRLAAQLQDVLERFPPLEPVDLPGPGEAEGHFRRYELFPRGVDHDWIWQRLDEPPQGRIALALEPDGSWRFSADSLVDLPGLHRVLIRLPPSYPERESGQRFLQVFDPTFHKTPWWGWLVLLAAICAGYAAARAIRYGSFRLCARMERHHRPVAAALARSAGTPAGLLVFSLLLTLGLTYIEFGPALRDLRWDLLQALLVLTACWLVIALIDLVSALLRARLSRRRDSRFEQMAVTAMRRALRAFVLVLLAIFILQNLVGIDIGAFLAGVGIIGLAISLAGQDSIKNLFGALTIFVNRPFMVGDFIRFTGKMGEHLGEVEDIGMQATTVREVGGDVTTIPNMLFIDREVDNLSARSFIRREMDIALPYRSTPDEVDRALAAIEAVLRDDEVMEDALIDAETSGPEVSFSGFGAYALNLRAYHWYRMGRNGERQRDGERGWYSYMQHCSLVNRKLYAAFAEAGLDFAFPTQTVEIRGADQGGLPSPAGQRAATADL